MISTQRTTAPPIAALPEQGQWMYDDWARLPNDGFRYEVIDGALFMAPPPATAHQLSSGHLFNAMYNHVNANKLGYVFDAPIGVQLPTQPVPIQPDIVFISAAHKSIIGKQYIEGVPDLIVEILSPSNWTFDRREKFQLYQQSGVPEYWIVDYHTQTIEVFVLEEGEYALISKFGASEKAASRVLSGFEVTVADIFRE